MKKKNYKRKGVNSQHLAFEKEKGVNSQFMTFQKYFKVIFTFKDISIKMEGLTNKLLKTGQEFHR